MVANVECMGSLPIKINTKLNKIDKLMKYEIVEKCEGKLPIHIDMEKPIEGATIIAYGQEVKIVQVVSINGKLRIYLEHPIVVPSILYTRDYISSDEIQRYVDF